MEHCAACGLPLKDGQVRCLHCGALLPGTGPSDPAVKTRHAWESICGKCGALLPGNCEACLVCGTERDTVPYDGKFPVAEPDGPYHPAPYEKQKHGGSVGRSLDGARRWGGVLTALLVVLTAALTGFGVWRQYFDTSGYRAAESVLYQTGNVVMLSHPGLAAPVAVEGVQLAAAEGSALYASPNGRYLALTTGAGELYQIDLSATSLADTAELPAVPLAGGLEGPVFYAETGGLLAYLRADGELFGTDYEEHWQLDTDVERLVGVEGRRVLYTRREDSGGGTRTDLYLNTLDAGSGEWILLDRDVREILDWTPDFGRILYTANRGADKATALLCYEAETGASELLAEGIAGVIKASAAQKTAFYTVASPRIWRYTDFIDDDMGAADARMREPVPEDYPELAEAIQAYGESFVPAEVSESEELMIQYNRYEAAKQNWAEKLERDELRRALLALFRDQGGEDGFVELWSYGSGGNVRLDTEVLAEEPAEGSIDAENGRILYRRIDPATLRKTRLSTLWRGEAPMLTDPRSYYEFHTREELRYAGITGEKGTLFIESDSLIHKLWYLVNGGGGVCFTVGPSGVPGEHDELFFANMRAQNAGAVSILRGVTGFYGAYRSGVAYSTAEGPFGVVSVAAEGNAAVTPSNARFSGIENDGQLLLDYNPYAEEAASGTLWLHEGDFAGGKQTLVSPGVTGYDFRGGQFIYLEKFAGDGLPPDLYLWRGGEARLVGKGPGIILYPDRG